MIWHFLYIFHDLVYNMGSLASTPHGKVLVTGTRFIPDLSKFESGFKRACQSAPKSGIRRVVLSHISLDLYQTLTQLFITLNSLEYNPTFPQLILNLLAVRIPGIDFKLLAG